ncbi:MAG TPA: TOMM precursor leader peptide-binding protein [Acidimicrobiales bacterium]|nr:TOMM precursor leader peptide-binding protein [Acidimicrobiales bacterium]
MNRHLDSTAASVLPARPLLPGFFRAIAMGEDEVQLRSAGRVIRLAGPRFGQIGPRLLSALDGHRTLADLSAQFALADGALEQLLRGLHDDGVLIDGAGERAEGSSNPALAEFLASANRPLDGAYDALHEARVLVAGLGPVARMAARSLAASGVGTLVLADPGQVSAVDQATLPSEPQHAGRPRSRVAAMECMDAAQGAMPNGTAGPTVVMEGDDPVTALGRAGPLSLVIAEVGEADGGAETVNEACLSFGVDAVFHETTPLEALVTTVLARGPGGCHECQANRRASHLRYYDEYVAYRRALAAGQISPRQPAVLGGAAAMAAGMVAMEALAVLSPGRRAAAGDVVVADFRSLEVRREALLAVPGCPACRLRPSAGPAGS